MNIGEQRKEIFDELNDKEYRDAYVKASIDIGVPSQILALREQRKWTQEELGKRATMVQESISRIEDPTRGTVNIKTLMRLASAFDLGLMVRFVPFSKLVEWKLNLSLEALEANSFDDDPYFKEEEISNLEYTPHSKIIDFSQQKQMRISLGASEYGQKPHEFVEINKFREAIFA